MLRLQLRLFLKDLLLCSQFLHTRYARIDEDILDKLTKEGRGNYFTFTSKTNVSFPLFHIVLIS